MNPTAPLIVAILDAEQHQGGPADVIAVAGWQAKARAKAHPFAAAPAKGGGLVGAAARAFHQALNGEWRGEIMLKRHGWPLSGFTLPDPWPFRPGTRTAALWAVLPDMIGPAATAHWSSHGLRPDAPNMVGASTLARLLRDAHQDARQPTAARALRHALSAEVRAIGQVKTALREQPQTTALPPQA